jgi:uncharacterized protein (TIGR03089 family)
MLRAAFTARAGSPDPLVTWCDDSQRAELSGRSFANAVAKAANCLVAEFDVAPESRIAVSLGCHWQSTVWHTAALLASATLTTPEDADLLVAFPEEPADPHRISLAISRHPLGVPDRHLPSGWHNASAQVGAAPDQLLVSASPAAVVWSSGDEVIHAHDLASAALAAVPSGDGRLAVVGTPPGSSALVCHAAVPLLLGIPVLLCPRISDALIAAEKVGRSLTFPVE